MIGMVATRRGSDSRSDIPLGAQGFAETFRTPTEGIPEHVELRLNGFTIGLGTVEHAVHPPHNRGNNRECAPARCDGNLVEIVAKAGQ